MMKTSTCILFASILTLGLSGYYGYSAYKMHQLEQHIRTEFQALPNDAITYADSDIKYLAIKSTSLNQYPHFDVNVVLTNYKEDVAPPKIEDAIKDLPCDGLKDIIYFPKRERIATLNVLKKDQIQYSYAIKNMDGKLLFQYQQVLGECHNFNQLVNDIDSSSEHPMLNMNARALAPKLQ